MGHGRPTTTEMGVEHPAALRLSDHPRERINWVEHLLCFFFLALSLTATLMAIFHTTIAMSPLSPHR